MGVKTSIQESGIEINDFGYDFQGWIYEFIEDSKPNRGEKVADFLRETGLFGKFRLMAVRYIEAIENLGTEGRL